MRDQNMSACKFMRRTHEDVLTAPQEASGPLGGLRKTGAKLIGRIMHGPNKHGLIS